MNDLIWAGSCIIPSVCAASLALLLRRTRLAHHAAVETVTARSQTVDRLLEFSQTIQAAGKPEQIFDALTLFLHSEFSLSGIAIIAHEPEAMPATTLKALYPAELAKS